MALNCTFHDVVKLADDYQQQQDRSDSFVFLFRIFVLSLGIPLNVWILFVSWGPTRVSGAFKYPVCNVALWDILGSLTLLYLQVENVSGATLILQGLAQNTRLCKLAHFLNVASVFGMLASLLHTPTQRLLVFYTELPLAHYALNRSANICFALFVSIVYLMPIMGIIFGPSTHCLLTFCGSFPAMNIGPLIMWCLTPVGYLLACVEVVFVVKKMKAMWKLTMLVQDQKKMTENREIMLAAIIQTGYPVVTATPFIGYALLFGIKPPMKSSAWQKLFVSVWFFNPVFDALTTMRVIKVYRRLLLKMICRKPTETATANVIIVKAKREMII